MGETREQKWKAAANAALDAAKPIGRAMMAVADAEQAQLRAEIERQAQTLRAVRDFPDGDPSKAIYRADLIAGDAILRAERANDRAEAAEHALADERAKVARGLDDSAITAALDSVDWSRIGPGGEASPRDAAAAALVAFRAALAGPESGMVVS